MQQPQGIPGGPISSVKPVVAARGLLVGIAFLMTGNGLQNSLIGVRASNEGFGIVTTGLVMTCYYVGFFVGGIYVERLIRLVGHIRVFAALASLASGAVLLHALVVFPVTWGLTRFVSGMSIAGLVVVAESWLNDMSTNATRGKILGMYMIATMGGMTIGQFALRTGDVNGFGLFVFSSLLVSVSLIPVTLSASSNPPLSVPEALPTKELARKVPTGLIAAFWVGASAGVLLGLGSVYAVASGLPEGNLELFLAAPLLGSIVVQWPIGWISDRIGRRSVMWWVSATGTAICVLLGLFAPQSWLLIVLMFFLGGTSFSLYSLTMAYTADWLPQNQLTAASASLVKVNGIGAMAGPLLVSPVMAITSPQSFFWALAVTHGFIVCYLSWRVVYRDPVPRERQRVFRVYPARASAVASYLMGRPRRHSKPN